MDGVISMSHVSNDCVCIDRVPPEIQVQLDCQASQDHP